MNMRRQWQANYRFEKLRGSEFKIENHKRAYLTTKSKPFQRVRSSDTNGHDSNYRCGSHEINALHKTSVHCNDSLILSKASPQGGWEPESRGKINITSYRMTSWPVSYIIRLEADSPIKWNKTLPWASRYLILNGGCRSIHQNWTKMRNWPDWSHFVSIRLTSITFPDALPSSVRRQFHNQNNWLISVCGFIRIWSLLQFESNHGTMVMYPNEPASWDWKVVSSIVNYILICVFG